MESVHQEKSPGSSDLTVIQLGHSRLTVQNLSVGSLLSLALSDETLDTVLLGQIHDYSFS